MVTSPKLASKEIVVAPECDHELSKEMLEMAECHGGMVSCLCGKLVRHYSPYRLKPRTEPCPHARWIPSLEDLHEHGRDLANTIMDGYETSMIEFERDRMEPVHE